MTESEVLLLQNSDGPLLALCPCNAPTILGEYVVAVVAEDGTRSALCASCSRQAAPELAACVEALGLLSATASGLSPAHSMRLLCLLVEQVARLAGPTVAFLNVNPLIIERINNP